MKEERKVAERGGVAWAESHCFVCDAALQGSFAEYLQNSNHTDSGEIAKESWAKKPALLRASVLQPLEILHHSCLGSRGAG